MIIKKSISLPLFQIASKDKPSSASKLFKSFGNVFFPNYEEMRNNEEMSCEIKFRFFLKKYYQSEVIKNQFHFFYSEK